MFRSTILMASIAVLGLTSGAVADTVAEIGDAGQTLATAQIAQDTVITKITGFLSADQSGVNDIDLFAIYIPDTSAFSAQTSAFPVDMELGADPMLHLFDINGLRVAFDDDSAPGLNAKLGGFSGYDGIYYLGISAYSHGANVADPVNDIFDGSGWGGPFDYAIALSGVSQITAAELQAVPLPAAAWGGMALLSGLGVTRGLRRRFA